MSAREIRRLRIKFIIISMISIFVTMLFIGLFINVANYVDSRREIYQTLDHLISSEGSLKKKEKSRKWAGYSFSDLFRPYYDQHTFNVYFYQNGKEREGLRIDHSGSDSDEMEEYADHFIREEKDFGNEKQYFYRKEALTEDITILVVLDCWSILSTRLRLQIVTIAVVIAGLLISLILVIAFSRKMIEPEIENSIRQEQFITNASHELKTPLAVIRSNTEMEELIHGESEWTQSTIRQVDRLTGLIQNLVMISKAREEENKSGISEINVSEVVKDSVDTYEVVATQDGKRVEKEITPDMMLLVDGSAVRQLTTILMDNASKYCDDKGIIRVSLKPVKKNKGMNLTVSNTYKAGETVDYQRFFDRFYREESHHNIDKGGYGIGLSIAQSICQKYGGDIRAEWKNGEISFICTLC